MSNADLPRALPGLGPLADAPGPRCRERRDADWLDRRALEREEGGIKPGQLLLAEAAEKRVTE